MNKDRFNYYDELKSGNFQSWVSFLNKHYMNTAAPTVKIFKLDKHNTDIDHLYGEETEARIYLRPFEMKAFYMTNPFEQMLGLNSMPYLESEDEMVFVVNFEDMVVKMKELKEKKISNLYISYNGNQEATVEKRGDILTLREGVEIIKEFDLNLSDYRTTKKLSSEINNVPDFSSYFEGDNDASTNLVSFRETRLKYGKLHIYSPNSDYIYITDVLEKGDLILTDKWRLYEIISNVPTQDIGWEYSQFTLRCRLKSLDKAVLPDNYTEMIRKYHYGLKDKYDMEAGGRNV